MPEMTAIARKHSLVQASAITWQLVHEGNPGSLREAQEEGNIGIARPFAIYADEDMVGFAVFAFDERNEERLACTIYSDFMRMVR